MTEDLVTVAKFSLQLEAELAREALREEGLAVHLIADVAGGSLPGLGDTVGGFVLQVPAADGERAREILEEVREEARHAAEEDAERTWLCPGCDAVVNVGIEICPSCGALREEPEEAAELATAVVRAEDVARIEQEPSRASVGDRLAQRAFRAAIAGAIAFGMFLGPYLLGTRLGVLLLFLDALLLLVPVAIYLYSGWLLCRLLSYAGDVGPSGVRKVAVAVLIDGIGLAACAWIGLSLLVQLATAAA